MLYRKNSEIISLWQFLSKIRIPGQSVVGEDRGRRKGVEEENFDHCLQLLYKSWMRILVIKVKAPCFLNEVFYQEIVKFSWKLVKMHLPAVLKRPYLLPQSRPEIIFSDPGNKILNKMCFFEQTSDNGSFGSKPVRPDVERPIYQTQSIF